MVSKAPRASKTSFAALRGLLPQPARAYSIAEMNQALQNSAAARAESAGRGER